MKKLKIFGCFIISLMIVSSLAACASEEENFKKAQEKFSNYTVNVNIVYAESATTYTTDLYIDGKAGMRVTSSANSVTTYYYKEENDGVYYHSGSWKKTSGITIEEATEIYNGFVELFQKVYYDDFEKDDKYLKMNDRALDSYSKLIGGSISSAKIIVEGDTIKSAIVILDDYSGRMQISYKFSNYGKTKVVLPE